jgi:hypothetical protein
VLLMLTIDESARSAPLASGDYSAQAELTIELPGIGSFASSGFAPQAVSVAPPAGITPTWAAAAIPQPSPVHITGTSSGGGSYWPVRYDLTYTAHLRAVETWVSPGVAGQRDSSLDVARVRGYVAIDGTLTQTGVPGRADQVVRLGDCLHIAPYERQALIPALGGLADGPPTYDAATQSFTDARTWDDYSLPSDVEWPVGTIAFETLDHCQTTGLWAAAPGLSPNLSPLTYLEQLRRALDARGTVRARFRLALIPVGAAAPAAPLPGSDPAPRILRIFSVHRGIRVRVFCPVACRMTGIARVKRSIVGSAHRVFAAARSPRAVTIAINRRARRTLRRHKRLAVRVRVTVRSLGGQRTKLTRTLVLRRAHQVK